MTRSWIPFFLFVALVLSELCCQQDKPVTNRMLAAQQQFTYHLDDADPGYISEDNLFRVEVLRTGIAFSRCHSGPGIPLAKDCETWDLDGDGDVDQVDFGIVQEMLR